ncbi:sensor histidine kinase [Streptacidiphilus jiangxiensis]|uniref:histidine kinase n=1 Tax=Streptacidiphilus jiangxiensis TaxID=235985 RepID=A0A1H7J789_STRJI|nr:HAMP domain-containing sensor histidine kinase [Streptacidiphilus jiangxiensis]SEK70062.1 two-component system, OmpR family, sensor kinase [Streptacidiphilus jiangxiensis]
MSFAARLRSRLRTASGPRAPKRGRFSLRVRLLALAIALVVLGLVVSDTLVLGSVRNQLVQRVDTQLQRFGDTAVHRSVDSKRPLVPVAAGGYRRTWLPSQYVVTQVDASGHYSSLLTQPVEQGDPLPAFPELDAAQLAARMNHPFTVPADHGGGSWRVLIRPVADGSGRGVVVAASLDDTDAMLSKLNEGFLAIGGGVLLVLTVAGFFAVRAGLGPLQRIEQAAHQIAEQTAAGQPPTHRVPGADADARTEVGSLARSLNSMLEQIEAGFAARTESEDRMRRFVADASHELRTPLSGIRGFAELYRMGALPDEADVKRTMSRIESEAVRMSGLVEDLLTLARLDEQRPLELAPMDLRTLAADALHDTTALDPTRPVSLTGAAGATTPGAALVLGDEARLRQVVTNLVGNAVKHTPAGTPVRIGVGTVGGEGVIEVGDEGPGLTMEQSARVFERFYRVDASRSRRDGGGAGLGLAIVSALTQAHGGRVELQTAPGAGAVFRIFLPGA